MKYTDRIVGHFTLSSLNLSRRYHFQAQGKYKYIIAIKVMAYYNIQYVVE